MPKYIEEKELREWIQNWFEMNRYYHPYSKSNDIPIPELYDILERMPTADVVDKERYERLLANAIIVSDALREYRTADVVEVVRCKKCKHFDPKDKYCLYYGTSDEEGFCKWGKSREEITGTAG